MVGSEQGGIRPVVIIQNDKGNKYSKTVIVAPISKKMSKPPIPTHVIFASEHLHYVSMILLEQIRTIDKRRLREHMGHLGDSQMAMVDDAIAVSFGLNETR